MRKILIISLLVFSAAFVTAPAFGDQMNQGQGQHQSTNQAQMLVNAPATTTGAEINWNQKTHADIPRPCVETVQPQLPGLPNYWGAPTPQWNSVIPKPKAHDGKWTLVQAKKLVNDKSIIDETVAIVEKPATTEIQVLWEDSDKEELSKTLPSKVFLGPVVLHAKNGKACGWNIFGAALESGMRIGGKYLYVSKASSDVYTIVSALGAGGADALGLVAGGAQRTLNTLSALLSYARGKAGPEGKVYIWAEAYADQE